MKCPNCKYENPSEAIFCIKCGKKLERKCPNCSAEYPEEALFCMKCGAKVTETNTLSIPRLEDMHAQLQSMIPDVLAKKYLARR